MVRNRSLAFRKINEHTKKQATTATVLSISRQALSLFFIEMVPSYEKRKNDNLK